MRKILLSPLAFGAVVFATLAQPVIVSAAEPIQLTGIQMDAVTAGTVGVGVDATATGATSAATSTSTTIHGNNVAQVGVGIGKATATGSGADTNVQTSYSADADKVIEHSTVHDVNTPRFSASHGVIVVVGINPPSH